MTFLLNEMISPLSGYTILKNEYTKIENSKEYDKRQIQKTMLTQLQNWLANSISWNNKSLNLHKEESETMSTIVQRTRKLNLRSSKKWK